MAWITLFFIHELPTFWCLLLDVHLFLYCQCRSIIWQDELLEKSLTAQRNVQQTAVHIQLRDPCNVLVQHQTFLSSSDTAPITVPSWMGGLLIIRNFRYFFGNATILPVLWNSCRWRLRSALSFRGRLGFEFGLFHGRTVWVWSFKEAHLKQRMKRLDAKQ